MRSKKIKKIIVKLSEENLHVIEVDPNVFDNPYMEAATQAIEKCKLRKHSLIRPIIECADDSNSKNKKKYFFNSYWILINASLHEKAEILREKFKLQSNIDLSKEPMWG